MSDNVLMRDYNGDDVVMRATDNGTAFVPHHIVDAVSKDPIVSTALENSHILSALPCSLAELDVYIDPTGADCYLMVFDSATLPADGAVTPDKFWKILVDTQLQYSPKIPLQMDTGCVVCISSTGPFVKTILGAHAFFSGTTTAHTGEAS